MDSVPTSRRQRRRDAADVVRVALRSGGRAGPGHPAGAFRLVLR